MSWWSYKPYVSVGQKIARAQREIAKLRKKGEAFLPVVVAGRKIATTFWGKAWCDNLQAYSDFASRLPRGRSYVCNGMVIDLQVQAGRVKARVQGSDSVYTIDIGIKPLPGATWMQVKNQCAGGIGSMIELLQGKFSDHVMRIITGHGTGLFPKPGEIELDCSCPDWAGMCKHVAAALYGVGARLDLQPELLFVLRGVDPAELVAQAADVRTLTRPAKGKKTLAAAEAADVFGIELEELAADPPPAPSKPRKAAKTTDKKPVKEKAASKKTVKKKTVRKKTKK
jgi:uncharacterized Zn finger protein